MADQPEWESARSVHGVLARPAVASGSALLVSMVVLLVGDVIGGLIGVATGSESWGTAWGFDTESTVPLPMGVVQLGLAWLAARNVRPPVGLIAAVVLGVICLISVLAGLFDGDLIGNVGSDGLISWGVVWGLVLVLVTAVVGLLSVVRLRQLRRLG